MEYYYNKLRKDRGFDDDILAEIKRKSICAVTFTRFDGIKLNSVDPFERAMEELQNRIKLFFSARKMKSYM